MGRPLFTSIVGKAATRGEFIREVLTGLILEIQINRSLMRNALETWKHYMLDEKKPLPVERLRGFAMSNYLARPVATPNININTAMNYSVYVERCREIMDFCTKSLACWENKKYLISTRLNESASFYVWGNEIENQSTDLLSQLGPITGL